MSKKTNYFLGLASGVAITMAVNFAFAPDMRGLIGGGGRAASPAAATSADNEAIQKKIANLYQIIDSNYIGSYDKAETIEMMYLGLVAGVGDPYTSYMDAATYASFRADTEGTFAGIGVSVTVDEADNSILIISPYEDSPGFNAGMLPGDKIIAVNGYAVYGDTLDEAVSMMRGEPGTTVAVTVYRENSRETIEMDITRETIEVETVKHSMLDNNIGYLRITQFDRVTLDQFTKAYQDLNAQNMSGLILDLRNNPGGLLDVVCKITDMLVPEGTIVYTEDIKGRKVYTPSDKNCINVPLLILVNGNSASASEVLSGAVKDMGVGELVGTTTFGKGLVQNIFQMNDGSAVKVTIAKYYTPSGVCIHGEGIPPNYEVEMSKQLSAQISRIAKEDDVQLNAAINIMMDKIK